jgi:hypothetical protein
VMIVIAIYIAGRPKRPTAYAGTVKPAATPPAPVRRTYPSTEAGFLAWLRDSGKKNLDGDQIESLRQTFYENQKGGNA